MNSDMPHREVVVTDPEHLHRLLEDAEEALIAATSSQEAVGILVTRHDHRRYTVSLSNSVPFGETHERSLL